MSERIIALPTRQLPSGGLRLLGDERLVRMAAAGDGRAFAAIYQRHHQALYRYCRSILPNAEDASDALQNTMLSALRGLAGERRNIALKPWLYRIAHNEAISLLRRREPQLRLEEAPEGAEADAATAASRRESLNQLLGDLRFLPERQRGALVMRELSGLDYQEIGSALSISPAAAKQAVYEARTALHELREGREMDCETVQRKISDRDGRVLRGRRLRGHLRSCERCCDFQSLINSRRRQLNSLAPPLSPALAAAVLDAIMRGGGGEGGGGGLAAFAAGGTGKLAGASVVGKAATIAAAAIVGGGGLTVGGHVAGGLATDRQEAAAEAAAGGKRPTRNERTGAPDAKSRSEQRSERGGRADDMRAGSSTRAGAGKTAPGVRALWPPPAVAHRRPLERPSGARPGAPTRPGHEQAEARRGPGTPPAPPQPPRNPQDEEGERQPVARPDALADPVPQQELPSLEIPRR